MKGRRNRKRSRRHSGSKTYGLAKSAAKSVLGKYIRNQIEHKYLATNANYAPTYNGTLANLSAITQGDTDSNRDGDAAYLTSISYRYGVRVNTTATYNTCRIILFRWNISTDLAAPTIAQILDNPGYSNTPQSNYVEDTQRQKRFKILYDKTHTVATAGPYLISKKVHIKLRSKLSFVAGGTDGRGHIYMLVLSGDSGAANPPQFEYGSKLNFTDS